MHPGYEIPLNKHLGQDDVVFIEAAGTVHVHPAGQERDRHAGGMVFIPACTWVSLKVVGNDNTSLVLSARGFENHLRCISGPADEKPTPTTLEREGSATTKAVIRAQQNQQLTDS